VDVRKIRSLVRDGDYQFSIHAEKEREADRISVLELKVALANCEVVEDYPDDPRGPSCLVLGFFNDRPIHVVCAVKETPRELLLITVYDPSKRPDKWTDRYRKRKE
jgi:Domain of unknown function (DUF4258)